MNQVLAKLSPRPPIFRAQSLDSDNPLKDIYEDLKEHGLYGTPHTEKVRAQHPNITKGVYLIVVDWLMELCAVQKLDRTVYYKTLAIFWRYLDGSMNLKADSCQCAIVACLSLASKFLTTDHLDFQELAASTDHSFTKADICTFEKHVFHCVGFNVHGVCSTHTYLYPVFHTINSAIHDCNDFCPTLDNHELIDYCNSEGVKPLNSDQETELFKLCLLVLDGLSTNFSFYDYRPIAIVLATIYAVSGWKLSLFRHMFGNYAQHLDLIRTRIHYALPSVHELGASPNELYVHKKAFWIQQLSLETQTKFVDVLNGELVYALPVECHLGLPRNLGLPRRHKKVTKCATTQTPAGSPLQPTPDDSPLGGSPVSVEDRYSDDCDLFAKFKAPKRTKGVEDDADDDDDDDDNMEFPDDTDKVPSGQVPNVDNSLSNNRVADAGSYTEFVAGMKRPPPAGPEAADKKARREEEPDLIMFNDDNPPPNKTVGRLLIPKGLQEECNRKLRAAVAAQIDAAGQSDAAEARTLEAVQKECKEKLSASVSAYLDKLDTAEILLSGKEPYDPSQQVTESPDV